MLVLASLSLAPFHRAFYRNASLFSGKLRPATVVPLLILIGCVLSFASLEPHVRWLTANSWWQVILSRDVPNSVRIAVAFTVALAAAALWGLVRPGRVAWAPWSEETRRLYAKLGAIPPVRADGLVWGEEERAAVPFRRVGRVLLALGDPTGDESDRVSAVWRLRDLAWQEGLDPAVWQAGRDLLNVYADLGLAALPLGEDGMPLAETEDAEGPHARRFLVCVAERDLPQLLPLLPGLECTPRQAAE